MAKVKTFTKLLLTLFDHFDTFPGGGGWGKSRLKTISVPVGIEIGTELGNTSKIEMFLSKQRKL